MSYSGNPLLPKAKADAVRLLVLEQLPVAVVARKSGIHRPSCGAGTSSGWNSTRTSSSRTTTDRTETPVANLGLLLVLGESRPRAARPRGCKHAVSEAVVDRIRYYRHWYGRCAVHRPCLLRP